MNRASIGLGAVLGALLASSAASQPRRDPPQFNDPVPRKQGTPSTYKQPKVVHTPRSKRKGNGLVMKGRP